MAANAMRAYRNNCLLNMMRSPFASIFVPAHQPLVLQLPTDHRVEQVVFRILSVVRDAHVFELLRVELRKPRDGNPHRSGVIPLDELALANLDLLPTVVTGEFDPPASPAEP